jgi:hypothetical protein
MSRKSTSGRITRATAIALFAGTCIVGSTGCQVTMNGQTLPSPYYLQDDVQYYPSGPEFTLSREAAALQAARAQEKKSRK